MKFVELTAVVWKEEGGYVSKCPELGVASCGDTVQEARINLKEAVMLFLENAKIIGLMDDIKESLSANEKYTTLFEIPA
ncbi:MAG: type II toxin-antitoxin system HicB family antitoxin [candidate division KSB1 bacterium]|nr:type II toxin-antitoxin system HicB family antitoxin [candidate division KSB1 bacterium]